MLLKTLKECRIVAYVGIGSAALAASRSLIERVMAKSPYEIVVDRFHFDPKVYQRIFEHIRDRLLQNDSNHLLINGIIEGLIISQMSIDEPLGSFI
jgi:hypothetical protein